MLAARELPFHRVAGQPGYTVASNPTLFMLRQNNGFQRRETVQYTRFVLHNARDEIFRTCLHRGSEADLYRRSCFHALIARNWDSRTRQASFRRAVRCAMLPSRCNPAGAGLSKIHSIVDTTEFRRIVCSGASLRRNGEVLADARPARRAEKPVRQGGGRRFLVRSWLGADRRRSPGPIRSGRRRSAIFRESRPRPEGLGLRAWRPP